MSHQRQRLVASYILIGLGMCLLMLMASLYLYGRIEAWFATQPRTIASAKMIWPEAPPLTVLPPPLPTPTSTWAPSPTPVPTPTATPTALTGVPALISIPQLKIERAIVPVGLVIRGDQSEWDTDKLYATRSRPDLVGHLEGTGDLGLPGNIVLTGHNYNRGRYNWLGVFYALNDLSQGDMVFVVSQENVRFAYQVMQIEKVSWPPRTATDMMKHVDHLTATADETLTLVTCGGAYLAPFPSRVYVTAKRVLDPDK